MTFLEFKVEAPPRVANLAALALVTGRENGTLVFVEDQNDSYELDTTCAFAVYSPLIVAASGGGRWFKRSKLYVVGNFTCWVQSYTQGVAGYTPGQLLASGNQEPDILLDLTQYLDGGENQQAVTTDKDGNLWFSRGGFPNANFYRFDLRDCLKSGAPRARSSTAVPLAGHQTEAAITTFDRQGNLWVGMGEHGTFGYMKMYCYQPDEYGKSEIPRRFIQQVPYPQGIAFSNQQDAVFDRAGNLWSGSCFVTNGVQGSNGGIQMFTAAQLAAGGIQPATVEWWGSNFNGPGLGAICSLAFSPDGTKLWNTDYSGAANYKVNAWNIAGAVSGNPAPNIVLTSSSFVDGPYGLAFDPAGNLWVNSGNVGHLMRIPAAQLGASGVVTPDIHIRPVAAFLTSKMTFPNNPDRSGVSPPGI